MKFNSIVFKVITPLAILTILTTGITIVITQTYLKNVISDAYVDLKVNNIKTIYKLKLENIISKVKTSGFAVARSQDVKDFLQSEDAANKKMPSNIKRTLSNLKNLYALENIYIAHKQSRNYYNENGFVKVVNTSNDKSSWFLNTLNEPKKYLINTDSDILGSVNVWNDVVVMDDKNSIGLAGFGISIKNIFKIALDSFEDNDAQIIILDKFNMIHASSKHKHLIHKHLSESKMPNNKRNAILTAQKTNQELITYNIKNNKRYLLLIPEKKLNWTVVVDFSKDEFLDSFNGIYNMIIAGATVFLLLLIITAILIFTYLVTIPLKKLSKAVDSYDYKSDFKCEGFNNFGYELKMISDSFNKSSKILKKTVERYKNKQELLNNIIDATDDLIFYKDLESRYIGCNKAYEKWQNLDIDNIVGKTDKDLYSLEIAESNIRTDKETIRTNHTIVFDKEFKTYNNGIVTLQVKKSPFYDKDGNIMGVVVITRDITKTKKLEKNLKLLNSTLEKEIKEKINQLQANNRMLEDYVTSLEELNEKLEKANEKSLQASQAKSNFISSISHELRTPLNAIINFSDQVLEDFDEILEDKELQDDAKIYLSRVIDNSKHLLKLINDLLDFAKVEAGKINYTIEELDIRNSLQTAYNNTHSLLNGTDIKFHINVEDKPLIALVDSRRFLQILLNLLSNAIKFTKEGSIELRAFLSDSNIIVEVEDTGKGIHQDKHKAIFKPFVQANNTDNGTGLGLDLVKKMCDNMNIQISFISEVDKGSTFRLSLPIGQKQN